MDAPEYRVPKSTEANPITWEIGKTARTLSLV